MLAKAVSVPPVLSDIMVKKITIPHRAALQEVF